MYKVITATITTCTALHLGTGDNSDLTDAKIRRDSKGRPFIPGTSIAGVLRTLLTRLALGLQEEPCNALRRGVKGESFCKCIVCRLLGDINPKDDEGSESNASRLLVFNAPLLEEVPPSLIRDGVGIERSTGAAARQGAVKFDLEVLPPGISFFLRMELRDNEELSTKEEKLLAAGLAEWKAGRLYLGGRRSQGMGSFILHNLEFKKMAMETAEEVLEYLKNDRPWESSLVQRGWLEDHIKSIHFSKSKEREATSCWFSLEGTLQGEGPLLCNDTSIATSSGLDHAPLLATWNDWGNPLLPGSSLRGVLRSHAESIARTMVTLKVNTKKDFLSQCPTCDPQLRDYEKERRLPLESCDSLLRKNDVEELDPPLCLSCTLFGSSQNGSRLIVEDATYNKLDEQDKPVFKLMDFLAIDRFTGGGADGFKFDALALWDPSFTIKIHLEDPRPWELGWLWLVLRDLSWGWLSVGFGRAKGFGQIRLMDWSASFGYLVPEDIPNALERVGTLKKSGVYSTITINESMDWETIAQGWVDEFYKKINSYKRTEELQLLEDTYFDHLASIYPVKGGL